MNREEEYDRRILDEFDLEALTKADQDAFQAFRRAIESDGDWLAAWKSYRAAVYRRHARISEVQSIATRLGIERRFPDSPGYGVTDLAGQLTLYADRAAESDVLDEQEERREARERFIEES